MAKSKKSGVNWKLYGMIAVVGAIVYFALGSSPPPPASKPHTKAKTAATASQDALSPIDYTVTHDSFQPVMFGIKDTFVPLVYRSNGNRPADQVVTSDLTIPVNFTGGEANWAFDAAPSVNGKISALVENQSSGQSEYLQVGQKWKTSTVKQITESLLILRDVSGQEKKIQMQADVQAQIAKQQADLAELRASATAGLRAANSPNAPLSPGLAGPIGAGDTSVQADTGGGTTYQSAGGWGGRGGRRSRRGGFGGGGGG